MCSLKIQTSDLVQVPIYSYVIKLDAFFFRYSSKCDIPTCNDKFTAGETQVVGIKKFSDFDLKFRKKPGKNSNKESFYWICASHCPLSVWQEGSSSSSSSEDE